jgi:hypothetical protein
MDEPKEQEFMGQHSAWLGIDSMQQDQGATNEAVGESHQYAGVRFG